MSTGAGSGDETGWLPSARRISSPNADERPAGMAICLLVIHAISLPPGEFGGAGIIDFFVNRLDPEIHPYYKTIEEMRVSAHFLIRRNGDLIQFVSCARRAWHAGTSQWMGRDRCNDFSIGIELEGCDWLPFEESQYHALAALVTDLRRRYAIEAIVGHSDIAPLRKTDPGPLFDWSRLA
ncbi:MAG: 1,6-anhydro-N-acetylmuramyl-L-alanine amidase AmpD [Betaproteobacteria bacterium HGW-Betaproteobacteria-11]|nr:MAG: 1,6-anhydro-N-acetylmuramyl-L-alanine amidase AmpD [Betaproteobacteria bacterium HGW-Betaproteobacteria-11]